MGAFQGPTKGPLSFRDYSSNSERAKHHFVSRPHVCVARARVHARAEPTPSEPQAVISPSQEKNREGELKKRAARYPRPPHENLHSKGSEEPLEKRPSTQQASPRRKAKRSQKKYRRNVVREQRKSD